jgi:hypothetical protein
MQSAGHRALSTLASKLHPQLPLTPRESKQLLQLLTTSFRSHLDREHPVDVLENRSKSPSHAATKERVASSQGLAAQHLDSILMNPLFAHKPRRRGSESAAAEIIKDPLSWFLDQAAIGAADLSKAATCLQLLQLDLDRGGTWSKTTRDRKPASLVAEWLRTSGIDTSKEFLGLLNSTTAVVRSPISRLIPMLLSEGNQAPLWRWFTRTVEERTKETGLSVPEIHTFRTQLLSDMTMTAFKTSLDKAFTVFLRANDLFGNVDFDLEQMDLRLAGARLTNRIIRQPEIAAADQCSSELYDKFLLSTSGWLNHWGVAVQGMLWLHHPTKSTAQPGLAFIKDPNGAAVFVPSVTKSRRLFLVQLGLGIARQSLSEGKDADAQVAMNFTKINFPDLVLTKYPTTSRPDTSRAKQQEKRNIDMLDRLLAT